MAAGNSLDTLDPELGRIVSEFLQALEAGANPSQGEWIARYPQYAEPLREFFANRQRFEELVLAAKAGVDSQRTTDTSSGARPAETAPLTRLRYFGDYELECEIARGGMGVVYRARQVSLNRPVAVKMILAGELASPDDVARFRAEAEAAANLDHPGIVPIYEVGQREGQHYFSMKFIDGESVAQRLERSRGVPPAAQELRQRIELVAAAARGIHYAHQRGIIHRDLKPANILIDSAGQPHITDFGLARLGERDSQLTRTGAILGTPSYMAPEQAGGGKSVTTAVDIYGLGAILYAVLTGRPPFEGGTPIDTILQVQSSEPTPPRRLNPAIDSELETVCLKCLAKDPEARYRSAGELADDLGRWLKGEPVQAAPPNAARLLFRWFTTHFRAAACALLIGIVAGLLVSEPVINMLAHNLGNYAPIYRGSFPGVEAPWVVTALDAYPRWIGIVFLPLLLISLFSMGWFTDRLIKPQDLAGAVLSGLGVGTTAAITAFLVGIGWQTIIQVAIWPSQPDLELLVAEITKDTNFSGGQTIASTYPADINGQPVDTRYVMKKALADMQARIPLALWCGLGLSACLVLLPATLQTVAAQYLRVRGDRWWQQILHLAELSIPASLALMGLGMLCWNHPLLSAQMLLLPLIALATLGALRRSDPVTRAVMAGVFALLGLAILFGGRAAIFTSTSGVNFGYAAAGAGAAIMAVIFHFRWWQRLVLYGIWIAGLILADAAPLGQARSSLDRGMPADQQVLISIVACLALLFCAVVFTWIRMQHSRKVAQCAAPA